MRNGTLQKNNHLPEKLGIIFPRKKSRIWLNCVSLPSVTHTHTRERTHTHRFENTRLHCFEIHSIFYFNTHLANIPSGLLVFGPVVGISCSHCLEEFNMETHPQTGVLQALPRHKRMDSVVGAVKGAVISSRDNQGRLHIGSDFKPGLRGPMGICWVKTRKGTWDREEHA